MRDSKNIVLLSDGTGNSSAKLMKTNVWRLYEALDLTAGDQIAMYDNGVGTSSFKLLAVLGGGLGWGLKRNVRDLYMFACRNYRPASGDRDADRLYAFGFSRGAFTIRVLIGLINDQGLITGVRGRELERRAKWAYREYRRKFNATKGLVSPLRRLRDAVLRTWERAWKRSPYDNRNNVRAQVSFLGLWDTVDAYGLPIDEMTRGWDRWVWPLSMCERTRPAIVDKVCHAMALDDERHTFHPVLLDESTEPLHAHTDAERVTQVWFAGVHSNVGGGYPDDSLAHVPLRWMAGEAAKKGLRLHPHMTAEWSARADPHGPAYDPRRGLGCYYRYNPRSIKKLTADRFADISIKRPKIHETVFQRIAAGRDDYAPIVLPEKYAVVTASGALLDGEANPYEHPTQSQSRCADQERVWNQVWLRRIVYFATVGLSVLLIVPPFVITAEGHGVLDQRSRALSGAIELLGQFLPASLQSWTAYYQRNPFQLTIGVLVLAGLMVASSRLQRAIDDGMRRLWDATVLHPPRVVTPGTGPTDIVYRFRSHERYRNFVELVSQRIFPFIFGFGALLAVVLVVMGTANRAAFAIASATGRVCPEVAETPPQRPGTWVVSFDSSEVCHSTGIPIARGTRYRLDIDLPSEGWRDKNQLVTTPAGFGSGENVMIYIPALPFRRVLTAQWFVPMARVGSKGAEYHTLDSGTAEFTPRRSGQLFLFVNDAIGVWPFWRFFYNNNVGGPAVVTVTKFEPATVSTGVRPVPPRASGAGQ
jgi:uncharacterized protein (DUF2235 family)